MNKWLELRKTLQELHEENEDKPDVKNVTRFLLNLMDVLDGKPNSEIWISVKDRMPQLRQWVLCKCRAGIYEVLRYEETCDGEQWHHDNRHNYMIGFVTHWMPIPDLPPEQMI